MLKILIITITSASLCLLIVLLNVTTPVSAGPFGILAIFISAYLVLLGLFAYLIHWTSRFIAYISVNLISRRPFQTLTLKRSYYYSTIIAAAPIMLIALQSVGTLGFYELLLTTIFIVIGCLYVSKKVN